MHGMYHINKSITKGNAWRKAQFFTFEKFIQGWTSTSG